MDFLLKKLFRSVTVGGFLGCALLTSGIGLSPADALTEQEIVGKLERVPVFLIVNAEGQPLTASATNRETEEEVKVPVVFTDATTAEDFLNQAREQDSDAKVALIDLGTLYEESANDDGTPSPLLYYPDEQEREAAASIQTNFQGVPLFLARQGAEGPYLTITQDGETTLPLFFSRDDLQTLLDRYTQENPSESGDISVEVLSLEWLLENMAANDDPQLDEQLSRIRLFPSSDVLQYIRSQQNAAPQGQ